jgi:hypothetical protein
VQESVPEDASLIDSRGIAFLAHLYLAARNFW